MTPSIEFAGKILKSIDTELSALSSALVSGNCNSLDQYKYLVGRIAGLSDARGILVDHIGLEGRQALGLSD